MEGYYNNLETGATVMGREIELRRSDLTATPLEQRLMENPAICDLLFVAKRTAELDRFVPEEDRIVFEGQRFKVISLQEHSEVVHLTCRYQGQIKLH